MQSSSDLIAACVSVKRQRRDLIELPHKHTHIHKFIHTKLSSYIDKFEKAVLEVHKFHAGLSSTHEVLPMACSSSILACVLLQEGVHKGSYNKRGAGEHSTLAGNHLLDQICKKTAALLNKAFASSEYHSCQKNRNTRSPLVAAWCGSIPHLTKYWIGGKDRPRDSGKN